MSESALSASSLDTRRRRIAYRAWHRGIREMDLILGQYVDTHIISLDDGGLDALEYIMSFEDRDLLTWFTGEVKTPDDVDTPMFRAILKYRETMDFV